MGNNKKSFSQKLKKAFAEKTETDNVGLSAPEARAAKREGTRSVIALIYVIGFLGIILITLAISAIKNFSVENNRDMLLAISGILSGPLGFIIGYYFKASREE